MKCRGNSGIHYRSERYRDIPWLPSASGHSLLFHHDAITPQGYIICLSMCMDIHFVLLPLESLCSFWHLKATWNDLQDTTKAAFLYFVKYGACLLLCFSAAAINQEILRLIDLNGDCHCPEKVDQDRKACSQNYGGWHAGVVIVNRIQLSQYAYNSVQYLVLGVNHTMGQSGGFVVCHSSFCREERTFWRFAIISCITTEKFKMKDQRLL